MKNKLYIFATLLFAGSSRGMFDPNSIEVRCTKTDGETITIFAGFNSKIGDVKEHIGNPGPFEIRQEKINPDLLELMEGTKILDNKTKLSELVPREAGRTNYELGLTLLVMPSFSSAVDPLRHAVHELGLGLDQSFETRGDQKYDKFSVYSEGEISFCMLIHSLLSNRVKLQFIQMLQNQVFKPLEGEQPNEQIQNEIKELLQAGFWSCPGLPLSASDRGLDISDRWDVSLVIIESKPGHEVFYLRALGCVSEMRALLKGFSVPIPRGYYGYH